MKTTMMLAFGLAVCVVTGGSAKATLTGGKVEEFCKQSVAYDALPESAQPKFMDDHSYELGACAGYVAGWMDATDGAIIHLDDKYLQLGFVNHVTVGQAIRVFVAYMENHPEFESRSGDFCMAKSMTNADLMIFTPVKPPLAVAPSNFN